MSKVSSFSKQNLGSIRRKMDEALKVIGEEFGINFVVGNIRFSEQEFKTQVTAVAQNGNENVSPMEVAFKRNARSFGLKAEDFGKEFSTYNGTYKITGMKPNNHKYPIIGECVRTGKSFKFPISAVRGS